MLALISSGLWAVTSDEAGQLATLTLMGRTILTTYVGKSVQAIQDDRNWHN